VVRFGRGARADEMFQDVIDGIRQNVSVGYIVHRVEIENRDGMSDLVTVRDWEPFEVSLVAVPADPTVGVGRSAAGQDQEPGGAEAPHQHQNTRGMEMKTIITRDADGNLVRAKVDDDNKIVEVLETLERAGEGEQAAARRGSEAEQTRVRTITEMGEHYGAADLALQAVRDGATPEAFQRTLLDHLNSRQGGGALNDEDGADIGMSARETQQFSFVRALRALADPTNRRAQEAAAFEFEASQAAAQRMGREPDGLLVPADVLRRALNSDTSGSTAGDTGGYAISTDLMSQSFIAMLRNRTVAMQLGTPMGGLVGNVAIPRQASGASGYWIGEDDDAPEDTLDLDQIGMQPKTAAALSDKAAFYGSGSGNQPLGIKNFAGINAVDFGTDGGGAGTGQMPTYAEVVEMESLIASDNADVASMAYVMGSGMRGHFKTTEKFSGSNGATIWEPGNTVNGYRSEVTNQIVAGDLFFGNFADLIVGMWGGLELTVDPFSHSAKGRLRVVAMQDVDFVLRRTESFCYGADTTA
jgi:HK97 family phage major capsid protein